MRTRIVPAFTLLFMLALGSRALGQAGPPLLTDDPETPGRNHWEINLATVITQTRDKRLFAAPLIDANYGVGDRLQLKAELPWLIQQDRFGGRPKSGLGSTNLGVKWRFLDQDRQGISMSVYPQLEFRTSASSVRKGLIEGGAELRLPIEVSREFGRLAIDGEFGYQIVQREKDELIYGFVVRRKANERLEFLGELHGESPRDLSQNRMVVNIGGRYDLSKKYSLLFSSGRSLHRSSTEQPSWIGYVGLQLHF